MIIPEFLSHLLFIGHFSYFQFLNIRNKVCMNNCVQVLLGLKVSFL